ncbi:hypothetical protein Tco_0716690 [Tanacetum coccineum]
MRSEYDQLLPYLLLFFIQSTLNSNKWRGFDGKMTLTFRNEMNEYGKILMNELLLLCATPAYPITSLVEESGLSYTPVPPIPPPLFDENESLTEKETEVTKDKVLPSTKDIQPPVIQKSHDPVKLVSSPISPEPSSAQVNNSPPLKEPSKETHLPYLSKMKAQKTKRRKNVMQLCKFLERCARARIST